jgi:hypothetical protein
MDSKAYTSRITGNIYIGLERIENQPGMYHAINALTGVRWRVMGTDLVVYRRN